MENTSPDKERFDSQEMSYVYPTKYFSEIKVQSYLRIIVERYHQPFVSRR